MNRIDKKMLVMNLNLGIVAMDYTSRRRNRVRHFSWNTITRRTEVTDFSFGWMTNPTYDGTNLVIYQIVFLLNKHSVLLKCFQRNRQRRHNPYFSIHVFWFSWYVSLFRCYNKEMMIMSLSWNSVLILCWDIIQSN